MTRFTTWISEWVETLRIAPPFSKRRRDLLAAIREADDSILNHPEDWIEVERPSAPDHNAYISMGTPRQYTQHGGWNITCGCGVSLGDTGNEPDWQARHEAHLNELGVSATPPEA